MDWQERGRELRAAVDWGNCAGELGNCGTLLTRWTNYGEWQAQGQVGPEQLLYFIG